LAEVQQPQGLQWDELDKLRGVVLEFDDVFPLTDDDRCPPALVRQYLRTLFIHRAMIADMIADMKRKGIVKLSTSSWASPIVQIPK